jgi:uncharacterized membrane protein YjfL (UPF0719 family)
MEMRMRRLLYGLVGLALILAPSSAAWAQAAQRYSPRTLPEAIGSTLVFSLIGIVVAIAGFKLFDMTIPFPIEREICEKGNIAAAILAGAVILGVCLIVGLVVLS